MPDNDQSSIDDMPDGEDYEEVIRYLMRSGKSREVCVKSYAKAQREVSQATQALLGAIESGAVQATGINVATGKREIIPPNKYKVEHDA